MLKLAVLGAGRMGREVMHAIAAVDDLTLAGVWLRRAGAAELPALPGSAVVSESLPEVLEQADVAVDFSLREATPRVLEAALATGTPLVCGVTGLDGRALENVRRASETIPLLYDRNMSLGIAVLKDLVTRAAPQLGTTFVAEIHETHHVRKKDAPSGTAIALGEALAAARGRSFDEVFRYDAAGDTRRLADTDIVYRVTRQDDVPGEHTVLFRSAAESLELRHKVTDRRVFAQGALQAARWLSTRGAGLYEMNDVIAAPGNNAD